jgi:rubrerythrin
VSKPFRKLLVKLILEQALIFEERAYRFYEEAFEQAVMNESKVLLRRLMKEELGHRIKLEEVQKRGDLGALTVTSSSERDDIEAISEKWPDIDRDATRGEILRIALKKEQRSFNFYRILAKKSRVRVAGEVFNALSNEELQHVKMIEEELSGNR